MNTQPAGSPDGHDLIVTGGRGYVLRLESLAAAAKELSDAAIALERAEKMVLGVRRTVDVSACTGSVLAARYHDEARRLEARAHRTIDEAGAMAVAVRRAAAAYEEQESRRARDMDGLQNILLGVGQVSGLLRHLGLRSYADIIDSSSQSPGRTLSRMLREAEQDRIGGSSADSVRIEGIRVASASDQGGTFEYALRSLRQAQGQVPLEDGSTAPGSAIMVERFVRADGSVAVMISVPGTETWAMDSPDGNLFDVEGILDGMAYRDSHARTLIRQALAEQALGSDDVVVFNAYSQGVIHVLGLLEEQEFRDQYRVAAVTAIGGPVSAFDVPVDVPVLSFSNADDIVPAAGARFLEPSGSVAMVRTPSRGGPVMAATFPQETVAQAHDLGKYAEEAGLLDRSQDLGVAAHAAAVGAALSGTAAGTAGPAPQPQQRERFVYTGTDTQTSPSAGKGTG